MIMCSIEERVNYYLGNLCNINNLSVKYDVIQDGKSYFPCNKLVAVSLSDLYTICHKQIQNNFITYGPNLINIVNKNKSLWKYKNKNILFRWGDSTINPENDDLFYITKARRCDSKNGVIIKMSVSRHWGMIPNVKKSDTPFERKKNILVWRGATTGLDDNRFEDNRLLAVNKMIDDKNCDVGFSLVCQGKSPDKRLLKNTMRLKEQLQYKYLLSLEGNDVASGLKWQLYSDSVVFMRKPRIVSWAMEDKLEPYVHYVPLLDDFSDFKEKIEWANKNQDKCKEISKNATKFIEQFFDVEKENKIEELVLEKYLSRMTINGN